MSTKYPGGFITKSPPVPSASAAKGIWTLDQALQLQKQGLWPSPPPTVIGQAYGGGFYAGQIGVSGVATHYLIVGPLSTAQFRDQWKTSNTTTAGTTSVIDGPANTAAMIAAGAAAHPCAQFCDNLTTGGFSDWYMAAQNELEICYFNLKPEANNNNTSSGINPNAVPARASNYTIGTPAQTSAANFVISTGSEFFTSDRYWSSTEASSTNARAQSFYNGFQYSAGKDYLGRVRAVRRIPA